MELLRSVRPSALAGVAIVLAAAGCGVGGNYTVRAGSATDMSRARGGAVTRCTELPHVKSAVENKSEPPRNIVVKVKDKEAADAVAACLRDLSYVPVTVEK